MVRICRLVEGMPLGILLAAAWMEMLSPAEIAAEIDRGLDFLITDRRDVPDRQRSIRAVFDYSWSLLTAQERDRFQQLSVFRGGFSREAAQAVAGASLFDLRALLEKSFVESGLAGRYEIHGLLRGYGEEALDLSPERGNVARDRHSAYFSQRLARWAADMKGERQQRAMDEIEADLDNVRAAWRWMAVHGPLERIAQAMDGLGIYYQYSGLLDEAVAAFRAAEGVLRRTVSADGRRLLAKLLTFQAVFRWFAEEWVPARELLQQSCAILESPELAGHDVRPEKAMTLWTMGYAADNLLEKEQRFQESLAVSRELGDDWGVAKALNGMAWGVRNAGDYERARRLIEEALGILRTLGDPRGTADALGLLGNITWRLGRYERSEHLLRETVSACEKMGRKRDVAHYRALLGTIYNSRGRFQQGISLQKESVRVLGDFGAEEQEHWWRIWLADCLVDQGGYHAAQLEAQTSHRFYSGRAGPRGTAAALLIMGRAALGTGAPHEASRLLEKASAVLRGIGDRDLLALALTYLAYAAVFEVDLAAAESALGEGLALASQIGALIALVSGVPALALLRARQGQLEQAVELYAVALTHPRVRESRWFGDLVGTEIEAAAATLPPDIAAAARQRGSKRGLEATVLEFVADLKG